MKVKALILEKPNSFEFQTIEECWQPKPDEVLVEVNRISLCGSDYKLFYGTYNGPCKYPMRIGHEWSGIVVDIGNAVTKLVVGDRVTGDCSYWCGKCANCSIDKNMCCNIEKYGISIDGFSQQMVIVPAKYLYKANAGIPHKVLALTECFAVALHAIHAMKRKSIQLKTEKILILGCGPIGMALAILLVKYYQFKNVQVFDPITTRVQFLKRILPEVDLAASITTTKPINYRDYYQDSEYSLIFEASGQIEALQQGIDLLKPKGNIITLGMYPKAIVDLSKIVIKSLTVTGSIGGTGEFPQILKFFSEYKDLVELLVTTEYNYDDAKTAFTEFNKEIDLKVQILFTNRG